MVEGQEKNFYDLPLKEKYHKGASQDEEEYIVRIKWIKTVEESKAISVEGGFPGVRHVVARPTHCSWERTVKELKKIWPIED